MNVFHSIKMHFRYGIFGLNILLKFVIVFLLLLLLLVLIVYILLLILFAFFFLILHVIILFPLIFLLFFSFLFFSFFENAKLTDNRLVPIKLLSKYVTAVCAACDDEYPTNAILRVLPSLVFNILQSVI